MKKSTVYIFSTALIVLIILADQCLKLWIKTHMLLGERIEITEWFSLYFTQNKGMAFGMDFVGTLFLTIFRLIAVGFFVYYLTKVIRKGLPLGLVLCLSLVIAGAFGNVIDNCFYGLIFSQPSYFVPASLVPLGQGDGSFLAGHVVDMLYFPLVRFVWPDWVPGIGGNPFVFFSPIFNIADAAISCGAIAILLFYRRRVFLDKEQTV